VCQRKNFSEGLEFWNKKYPGHSFHNYDYGDVICYKTPDMKCIWSSKGKHRLYDLKEDPGEVNSLYSASDPTSQTFISKCQEWIENVPKVIGEDETDFDEEMRKQLRGLGYLE
jgi:hypothetical protein